MRFTAGIVVAIVASGAEAQTDPALESARKATADAYARVQATLAEIRRDSVRRFQLPIARQYAGMELRADTTQIPPDFMATLDQAFGAALKEVVPILGQRAHSLLTNTKVTLVRGLTGDSYDRQVLSPFVTFRSDPGARAFWYQTAEADPADFNALKNLAISWFTGAAYDAMPANLRAWMGKAASLHANGRPNPELYSTYREIARSNRKSSRACLEGAIGACRSLMAIEPGNDTAVSWLDEKERRDLLAQLGRRGRQYMLRHLPGTNMKLYESCMRREDDNACRDALRSMNVRAPVSDNSRTEVWRLTLAIGGPEAYARMEASQASEIGDVLAAGAGVPIDSVVSRWRAMVVRAMPHSPAPNSREILVGALLCIGALAVSAGRRP
jgi:hypothetical protein